MWDAIKDYMNSFIGAVFLLVSLIAIPEIRKQKKYWIMVLILVIFLTWLGFDKISRDGHEKGQSKKDIESLGVKMDNLQKGKSKDSLNRVSDSSNRAEFDKKLLEKFHIKDSANTPTYINNGKQLNVEDNHGKMDIKF